MKRNRGYKKGEPYRDARLFVIACEGEKREKEYFERLGHGSQRLKIQVLAPDKSESRSAPKWILDRLVYFIEKEGINTTAGDIVWIVMDVDSWPVPQLYELSKICQREDWGFALSNPCFEIWLFMHVDDISKATAHTCQELKYEIGQIFKGGYHVEKFVGLAQVAVKRANEMPDDKASPIPAVKATRVHLPVAEILNAF